MARKTKAELNAEREAAEARRMLAEAEAYPARLMAALEEATTLNNYELEVRNGKFMLRDRDASRYDNTPGALTLEYTRDSQVYLENLEYDLQAKALERAAQRGVRAWQ